MMQHPQHIAAHALRNAHAMTDVTGFGLVGHVQEICTASGLQAEIWRDAVPFYDGARALSDAGVKSSLLEANIANAPTVGISDPLLHDPQTAGGMLAALPRAEAEVVIQNMKSTGQNAVIIGVLSTGVDSIKVT
jgi:selenide,water dikinase